jgi:hypothetical protein
MRLKNNAYASFPFESVQNCYGNMYVKIYLRRGNKNGIMKYPVPSV